MTILEVINSMFLYDCVAVVMKIQYAEMGKEEAMAFPDQRMELLRKQMPNHHYSVTCDICGIKRVKGNRYKCG